MKAKQHRNHARILAIGTALPAYAYDQASLAETLLQLVSLAPDDAKRFRRMSAGSGIATRHSVLPDYRPGAERRMYPASADFEPTPPLEARMATFHAEALPLAVRAIENSLAQVPELTRDQITHLIAVSCTGMVAPGLDLMLLKALELPAHTHRTAVHFMGCYAAMHGLKQADAICRADPESLVLVVCVELCTLHFQKDPSPDNLAASLLFADGAAAALVAGEAVPVASPAPGLQLAGFYAEVALAGWQDMAWQLSGQGFLMKLSAYVPELLRQGIRALIQRGLSNLELEQNQIDHWALHPGGRKILELAMQELELPPGALDAAYAVLRDCGNMSSPTVLFVLARLWPEFIAGQKVLAAAFGPGLTMETLVATVTPAHD